MCGLIKVIMKKGGKCYTLYKQNCLVTPALARTCIHRMFLQMISHSLVLLTSED
ncbi:MAG: hypothetical protein JXB88_22230 [Spirochaetales bacterium]|nr:hypothetical protein [Spirochaetales bacterium]